MDAVPRPLESSQPFDERIHVVKHAISQPAKNLGRLRIQLVGQVELQPELLTVSIRSEMFFRR